MKKRRLSILLSIVMLFSLLPTTAFAAGNPDPTAVFVDEGKSFYNNRLYYKKGDQDKNFTGNEGDYIAHYNPATGTLTLNGYSGGSILVGGVKCSDITVVLKGTNTINGSLENAVGGDITVTSSDGGTLSISKTTSGSNSAIGIETGLSASYTTGNVTIKGNAKVTINMTHNGTSTYEKAYGIFAKENITISENASVDITCATPNNTTGGGNCNGLYAAKDVTIDTNGTIKIDVTNAGRDKDNGYSYGVYHMRTATLTKVGNMEVQWKKEGNSTRYSGGAFTKGATFSDTDHAINEDTTNCYASYRYGTSYYTVTAGNGELTGPGVKYPNGNGKFLVGDTVNIKPNEKKSSDGTLIPFKEWTSEGVALASPTTLNTSFNVPTNDVTVTATYNPFDGAPVFTRTSDSSGTIKFKTVANPDNSEFFEYVKDGETAYNRPYSQPTTTSSASPYEYSLSVSTYYAGDIKNLEAGDYRMAVTLNGERYLSEKFTVNYTAPVTTYTVSFNANGGTGTMADVTDISGEYTLPANGFTAPAGKQFKAWSVGGVEKAAGDKITVTANTTVTAVWEDIPVVTYTVSFDANGGTGTMADVTGISGEYTLPANGFTAPAGKQFKAWSVGGVEKAAGDKITVTANTTVTAVWEAIEYNVTVTGGTASVGAGTPITKATMGTTVTLTAGAAPSGKVFDEWEVVSGGITLADVNSATTTFTMPASAVSVKATYKTTPVTTYNLTTQVNGGHGTISASKTGLTAGSTETITFNPEVGYEIDTVTVNGTATSVSGNTLNVTMNENKTVVVTYKAIEYNITVTDGKATIGAGSEISKAAEGTVVTLTANAAPSGKVFDKWEVVSGGITLADANSATTTFTMPASAVSVKATYKTTPVTTYNLTTQVNGGHGTISASKTGLTAGSTETITFNPEVGYEIDTVTVNGTATSVSGNTLNVTMNENKTVVVTYKAIEYNITVTDGKATIGAGSEISKAAEGTVVTLTANAAPSGKVFDKWEVVSGGITLADANSATTTFTMPASAVSVKATYKNIPVVTYTVTFNANGGTTSAVSMQTGADGKLTSLPNASRSSYTFAGWYTAISDGIKITTAYVFSANTTVHAHWTYTGGSSSGGGYVPKVQKPEITIIGSGKADLSADGRTATITAAAGHELVSVVLNGKEMGKVEKLTGLKTGDKATITFRAKTDGKVEMDKIIAQKASKLTLMARSKKTAKLNIKVVVKGDLKAITDAGYTVKYKFYRSTKKSAGYKAVLTKKAPTYFNTYGKKGTMYYYKARVMIYDKDGNFVAQTALKQCKYANRLWTK